MTFRFELTIGALSIIFDRQPSLDDDDSDFAGPDDAPIQGLGATESLIEREPDHFPPGLHVGFRGGYYEE